MATEQVGVQFRNLFIVNSLGIACLCFKMKSFFLNKKFSFIDLKPNRSVPTPYLSHPGLGVPVLY